MWKRLVRSGFRFLASLKLAVVLLVSLAIVLSWATVLETRQGADYARWYVYGARWFVGLLAVLGVNIFCAAAIRFPWKRHQTGFVITHAGLLILLTGSILTFARGIEGRVSLVEGQSTQTMSLSGQDQIHAFWVGRPQEASYEFTFEPGPSEWSAGKTLDLGEVDGVSARILKYLKNPRVVQEWVPDTTKSGGPAVRFKVTGKDGVKVAESWLVDQRFGDAVHLGPLSLQLERAVTDEMLKDFLHPPAADDMGEKGLLAMYHAGAGKHVPVDKLLGEKIDLGTDGLFVEIKEYLPNATPDNLGNFTSKNDVPKNPMLELRVHLPGASKPLRQIAFAKDPLLNLDGVYSQICPVKFRYYHPSISPKSGVEFLQTSDGKLFGRRCWEAKYESLGEVASGFEIATGPNFTMILDEYLPSASQKTTFEANDSIAAPGPARKQKNKPEPAVLVELNVPGTTHQIWMRRNDPEIGAKQLETPAGTLAVNYEQARAPLGFSLKLLDFQRERNPGNAGNAAFSSRVQVVDEVLGSDERTIGMNAPLTNRKFTFYQSSFDDAGHGRETSTFSVAYDPGRTLKYCGCLMICLGIAIMFYMRAYFFKSKPQPAVSEFRITQSAA